MANLGKYSKEDTKISTSAGCGFLGFLQLIFITLKLIGIIDWSWWWVLSPIWIPIILIGLILGIFIWWVKR